MASALLCGQSAAHEKGEDDTEKIDGQVGDQHRVAQNGGVGIEQNGNEQASRQRPIQVSG